jgi:type IV pilus assembly protein PilN
MTSLAFLDGFNLLPYRSRKRREARNRRLALLASAGLAGCAAVGAVAGWDAFERARLDDRRAVLEAALRASAADVAEHGRLTDAEAERRRARQAAEPLAVPRTRFLALLDALADAPAQGGVALRRVSQKSEEVEIAAFAPDSQAASRWLKHLEKVRDVQAVEVVEMKRRTGGAASAKRDKAPETPVGYEFTALVRWSAAGAPAVPPARAVVAANRRSIK